MRQSFLFGQRKIPRQFQTLYQIPKIFIQRFDEPDEQDRIFTSLDLLHVSEPIPIAGSHMSDTPHRVQSIRVHGMRRIQRACETIRITETRKGQFFVVSPWNHVRGSALSQTAAETAHESSDRIPDAKHHPVSRRNIPQPDPVRMKMNDRVRSDPMVLQRVLDRSTAGFRKVQKMQILPSGCRRQQATLERVELAKGKAHDGKRLNDDVSRNPRNVRAKPNDGGIQGGSRGRDIPQDTPRRA